MIWTCASDYASACPKSTLTAGSANSALRCAKPLILRDGEPREDGWSVHKTGRFNGYFYMNLPDTLNTAVHNCLNPCRGNPFELSNEL